jgi:hypothetical protein
MRQNHQEVNAQFHLLDTCVYRELDLPYDLPEEDPMEFVHGIDLAEVEIRKGSISLPIRTMIPTSTTRTVVELGTSGLSTETTRW